MTRLGWLAVLAAIVAGGGMAASNAVRYDVLQPIPLAWNHRPDEIRLLELERERRGLLAQLASSERIARVGGVHLPLEATAEQIDALTAELAALDARIWALQAEIQAR